MRPSHVSTSDYRLNSTSLEEFRRQNGDWSAMSIHLGGDLYTRPPAPDARLRRIVQITSDLAGKPLHQLRILDLACLEGHYAIEFAMHGAEVVGIELREQNLAKARFVKDYLGLDRLSLYLDDVRNLSREKYGLFDVVLCSGILYHLDVPDVFHFLRRIYDVCAHFAIVDTQVALRPAVNVDFEDETYSGLWYTEHQESADRETKLRSLWASVDNNRSFWFTPASLANFIDRVGFSSFHECLNPHHDTMGDRRAYIAIKGKRARILSSPKTASLGFTPKPEVMRTPMQSNHGPIFRIAKGVLPQPVKDVIKPVLRKARLLPPDSTPPFLKKR